MENSDNNDRPRFTPIDINASKQTMYIQHGENLMSPKLNYNKRQEGEEADNFLEIEENSYLRNTQPAFPLSLVEKTSSDIKMSRYSTGNQAETPTKLRSVSKLKEKSKQKDLLREIANTQERRPYNLQYHQQQRKFRNTANSFASDQDSNQQPESVHNLPVNKGNNDLADVSPNRLGEKEIKPTQQRQSNSKQKRYKKANVALTMRPAPQLTNLTQAYTEGVSKLISTLPFQQQKQLKPIVSASLDMKSRRSPGAQARKNMILKEQLFRVSQESNRSLPKDSLLTQGQETLRKSIQVNKHMHYQSQLTDESHQNSGQLHSNRSLGSGFPLQAMKSSVFRIEQAQDYTDLKLDFTSQIMTEHQSQTLLETLQPNIAVGAPQQSGDKKVRIKSKLGNYWNMSQPQGLPSMEGPGYKKQCPSERKITMDNMINNKTERRILGILDKTDYHTLRQHADPAPQSTSAENCTCYNQPNHTHEHHEQHEHQQLYRSSIVSQSIDYSQLNMTNHNAFRMTDKSPKPDQGAYKKEPRNILSIQLRPLKGKAEHRREYRDMIEKEYGKEKKKQIYETMYSQVSRSPQAQNRASSLANPFIKLNLRSEKKREAYKPRRNQHVKLQTISPRGEVNEKLVPLDEQKAERMNTTFNSSPPLTDPSNAGFMTLRHSTSRWRPGQAMTQKQFYLFSPSGLQMANQRYLHEQQKEEKSQASIVNLQISTGDDSKKNRGNQINLGYVGLHEKNLATDYLNYLIQDETTLDSTTDLGGGQVQPFGRIYSRMSKDVSKYSSNKTPKPEDQELKQTEPEVMPQPIQIIQPKKTAKNKTISKKKSQNQTPQNQKTLDKSTPFQRQSNMAVATSTRAKDSGEKKHKSKSKDPVFHRAQNLQQMKPYFILPKKKTPVEKNLRHTKKKLINNKEIGIKIDETSLDEYSQDGEQQEQDSDVEDEEFFPNVDHVKSLEKIEQLPITKDRNKDYDDSESADENPLDQYDSTELLAINKSQEFELFSNPTEIEIVTTSYQQSNADWESKKRLQQQLILQKKINLKKKEDHLGPLERKSIKLQKQNNNIRLSQISVVNEFYKEEDEDEQNEKRKHEEEKNHPYIQIQKESKQ